jgi:hypothetical protein
VLGADADGADAQGAVGVAEHRKQYFGLFDRFDLILRRFGEKQAVVHEDLHR